MFFMSSIPVIFGFLFNDERKINNNQIIDPLNNNNIGRCDNNIIRGRVRVNNDIYRDRDDNDIDRDDNDIDRDDNDIDRDDNDIDDGIRENKSIDNLIEYGSM